MKFKSNEEIINKWNQTEVSQRISDSEMFAINHGFPEWHKPTVVDFWIDQRLQDLQAIKEMVEEVKKNYLTLGSKPTDIELGAEYALKGVSQKLDELMNK